MESLIDTNILVYRFDARDPDKQRIAREVLYEGQAAGTLVLPYQALVEFVAAVTRRRRDLGGARLMAHEDALLSRPTAAVRVMRSRAGVGAGLRKNSAETFPRNDFRNRL